MGCAPDTFLAGGHQHCRHLVDEGAIGRLVAAFGTVAGHGPDAYHANPHFFYENGAGPMLDQGVYIITALLPLFGRVETVSARAQIGIPDRTVLTEPRYGEKIEVQTPTPPGVRPGVRGGRHGQPDDQLGDLGLQAAGDGGVRDRGHPAAAALEPLRGGVRPVPAGAGGRRLAGHGDRAPLRRRFLARPGGGGRWPPRCWRAGRTAPRASAPTTCWKSWEGVVRSAATDAPQAMTTPYTRPEPFAAGLREGELDRPGC